MAHGIIELLHFRHFDFSDNDNQIKTFLDMIYLSNQTNVFGSAHAPNNSRINFSKKMSSCYFRWKFQKSRQNMHNYAFFISLAFDWHNFSKKSNFDAFLLFFCRFWFYAPNSGIILSNWKWLLLCQEDKLRFCAMPI